MTQETFEKAVSCNREIDKIDTAINAFNILDFRNSSLICLGEAVVPFKQEILQLLETLKENKQQEILAL